MKVKLLKQIRREFEIKYFSNEHNEKLIYLKNYQGNTMHFCNNVKEAVNAFQFWGSRWLKNKIEEICAKKLKNRLL